MATELLFEDSHYLKCRLGSVKHFVKPFFTELFYCVVGTGE